MEVCCAKDVVRPRRFSFRYRFPGAERTEVVSEMDASCGLDEREDRRIGCYMVRT